MGEGKYGGWWEREGGEVGGGERKQRPGWKREGGRGKAERLVGGERVER